MINGLTGVFLGAFMLSFFFMQVSDRMKQSRFAALALFAVSAVLGIIAATGYLVVSVVLLLSSSSLFVGG